MLGKALGRLYDGRQSADYDVFMKTERKESERSLADAKLIAGGIIEYANRVLRMDLPGFGGESVSWQILDAGRTCRSATRQSGHLNVCHRMMEIRHLD